MSPIRQFRRLHQLRDTPRGELRDRLRKSVRGDTFAYNQLIQPYIDLALEFLAASGFQNAFDRRQVAFQVFEAVYHRLGYASRVSDFEYLLARILFMHAFDESSELPNPLLGRLARLPVPQRFALVAREMEDWHPHWISLCTRNSHKQTRKDLLLGRCALLEVDLSATPSSCRQMLGQISFCFDSERSDKEKTKLARKLDFIPEAKAFKANWLELRSDLIDLRQDCRFSDEEKQAFQSDLATRLRFAQIDHPSLAMRLRNMFSFTQFPEYHPS